MKKYSKYKDSGVQWVDSIPEHWEVKKVKYCFPFATGFTPSTNNSKYYDGGEYLWFNISDLNKKVIFDSGKRITKKAVIDYKPKNICKGALLYSFKLSLGKVSFAGVDCYTNEAIFSIIPTSQINIGFFYYSLPQQLIHNANENIYGAKIMNQELIKNAFVIIPPLEEQKKITEFLDKETTQIDSVILNRKQQIELLTELKSSIITHAVTKGINPSVKLKDSGVEWIGEVPEHWEIKRLNEIGKYRKGPFGSALKVDSFVSKALDTVKVYEQQNAIKKSHDIGSSYISKEYFHEKLKGFEVLPGDIIVSCAGTIGETYLMPDFIEKGIINQALMRMRMKKKDLDVDFFLLIFQLLLKEEALKSSNGSAIKNIPPFEVLKKIRVPFPSLKEQQEIVSYIKTKVESVDISISKYQKQIYLLTEYKTSLITEAVTGKIDVREIQK